MIIAKTPLMFHRIPWVRSV